MKNFSFILNSRGRPSGLRALIHSIAETSDDLGSVDMLVAMDNDDETLQETLNEKWPFSVEIVVQKRPESLNQSLTDLAFKAKGDIIWNQNDDCVILTKGWNSTILNRIIEYKKINNHKDSVLYIGTKDTSIDKPANFNAYSSFPMLTKETVNALGFFMDKNFCGLGADNALFRVMDSVKRTLFVEDVITDHYAHNNLISIISCDRTAAEMRAKSWQSGITPDNYDYSSSIKRLQDFIDSRK